MTELASTAFSYPEDSISIFSKNAWAILVILGLCACDGTPLALRTDEQPVSLNIGGDRYVIPANYLDSLTRNKDRERGGDGALVIASWPEMGGRPKDGKAYKHYAESNIAVLVGPAKTYERQIESLEAIHEARTTRPLIGGMEGFTPPKRVGDAYGFEHWVREHTPREKFHQSDYTHTDIYLRYNSDGQIEAVMTCSGEPAPRGKNPQCELRIANPKFPGTSFKISFDRSEALHDVNEIEIAVFTKFSEFKAAGSKAQAEGTFE